MTQRLKRLIIEATLDLDTIGDDATPAKINALRIMQLKIDEIEAGLTWSQFLAVRHLLDSKRDEIQRYLTKWNQAVLHPDSRVQTHLASLIARMPSAYAEKLIHILGLNTTISNRVNLLSNIFDTRDMTPIAVSWRKFIQDHTIEVLSDGNNLNFKITNIISGAVEVLKLENNFGGSRTMSMKAERELPRLVVPSAAHRTVHDATLTEPMRTLMVVPYFTNSSVPDYVKLRAGLSDSDRHLRVLNVAKQMGLAFKKMQDQNIYFPDGKDH